MQLDQKVGDLLKATFSNVDDLFGSFGIIDGGVDGGLLTTKVLTGDQARRIVRTAVDPKTGGEPLKALVEAHVLRTKGSLSDHAGNVLVDATHDVVSSVNRLER